VIRSRVFTVLSLSLAASLLGTLGAAPRLWFRILPYLQPHVTLWYAAAGAVGAALLAAWAISAGSKRRREALAALLGLLVAYGALLVLYYRGEPPAKKFHLLEYGLLALLTLQAVRVEPEEPAGLVAGLVFLVVVGTADETAQRFVPMRTFRWLDLFANYIGAGLGALAWTAASPHSPWRRGGAGASVAS
jgi:VanZ family protein